MLKYMISAFIAAVITYLLRLPISTLTYSSYKETLDALLNISSIIFAIIGAWIAIIYPRAIGRVFKRESGAAKSISNTDKDTSYLSELVEIVLVSAIVLMIVLTIQFSVPLIREIVKDNILITQLRLFAFFGVALLTFCQLNAVFRVILANYFFLNELRSKSTKEEFDARHY